MDFNDFDEEQVKYRKKRKKTHIKSNHKHDYSENILLRSLDKNNEYNYHSAQRCTICGKITNEQWFTTKKIIRNGKVYHAWEWITPDLEEYKDYIIVDVLH